MDADAGRVRTALRLQAVAARVHHMDCAGFAEEVCDAVDVAGRLGYLGCLHAVVRLAAAREAMPDADGMTCGELGCLAGLRRQARATDTLDADSFTARILAALDIKGWSDRSSYQIAAMRLADLIAPVSLMASPERTERGDRALYSYTCGRSRPMSSTASSRAAAGTRGSASHPPETAGASSTCRYRTTPSTAFSDTSATRCRPCRASCAISLRTES